MPAFGRWRRPARLLLFAALAVALVGAAGCGGEEVASPASQVDEARDASVKAGILAIESGIQAYIATTRAAPPQADQATLGAFVQPWPSNPWTKAPMREGDQPGDYSYAPGPGTAYRLVGHLSGGREFARP